MGQLHDQMEADLVVGGYSPSTRKIYLLYARRFARHFMRSPAELGADDVRRFLLHLVQDCQVSRETLRQVRSALRFLYAVTLNRPVDIEWLPVPRGRKRLPEVLSGSEVAALLDAVRVPKYRMIFATLYAAGLRISEACALRPEYIDSKRKLIRVVGKGNKERCTLLSPRLLRELRDYWRKTRPQGGWLFPGKTRAGHISKEAARKVFRDAVQAAGITKKITPHVLRHTFAIRHYGLHASRNVNTKLVAARKLLDPDGAHEPTASDATPEPTEWWERFLENTGIDVMACPCCGGRLVRQTYPRGALPPLLTETRARAPPVPA